MNNIVTLFNKIAEENKNEIAVISDNTEYTYEQLDQYSNYIAAKLNNVAQVGDRIGIYIERSFDLIAAILGVLKAGMVYVPLDESYPKLRLQFMCETANIAKILCKHSKDIFTSEKLILLENDAQFLDEFYPKEEENAYIIFTSGSSGTPKGVLVSHKAIMNTLLWRIKYYELNKRDRVLQIPSVSYSSSVEDIFSTLLSGGTLVMIRQKDLMNVKRMAKDISSYEVTHLLLIPSLYNELIPHLIKNKLRFVVVAGEALSPKIITKHYKYMKDVKLYNEYGMTETSVAFSACLVEPDETRCVIGTPINNMNYIIDNEDDGIGELVVLGIGVVRGYINEENSKQFTCIENSPAFYTGDLVRVGTDGQLLFCGRKDSQIKINGKRFDLLEISTVLKKELDTEVVTILNSKNKIVCFIEGGNYSKNEIDNILKEKIPVTFLPQKYIILNSIFKLPNGKVDYRSLREMEENKS